MTAFHVIWLASGQDLDPWREKWNRPLELVSPPISFVVLQHGTWNCPSQRSADLKIEIPISFTSGWHKESRMMSLFNSVQRPAKSGSYRTSVFSLRHFVSRFVA